MNVVRADLGGFPRSDVYGWAGSRPGYDLASRLIDLAIASTALLIFSPAWLAIAAAIRATSPGPALFSSTVVGRHGQPFTYYKFRSMVEGDDSHHKGWLRDFVLNDKPYQDGSFKVRDDKRITPLGRVLRRLSIDEVPQLINVLRGR